jgi:hypothetical protein
MPMPSYALYYIYTYMHAYNGYTLWVECRVLMFSSYLTGNTLRHSCKPNRLMLFKETVAVYCENHTEHTHRGGKMRLLRKTNPVLSSRWRPHFKTYDWSWKEQRFGHEYPRDLEPRTVLARVSAILLLCYAVFTC